MSFTPSIIDAITTADDLPARLAAALAAHRTPLWPVSGPLLWPVSRPLLWPVSRPSHSPRAGSGDPPATCGVGRPAHNRADGRRFAPELSYGRHFGPAPATTREAAVVVLLFRRGGRWHLPLTERPASMVRHGGQISLPGGTLEAGESSVRAALRELDEELGIRESIELVGRLSQCYVFASDYVVTPWLAATSAEPLWRPQADEVTRVIELSLANLLDADRVGVTTIQRGPVVFRAPCYWLGEHAVWGATSVILGELAGVLARLID